MSGQLPNQHDSLEYSARYERQPGQSTQPLALAHFMGARRDINGPLLTRTRVDEREVRPDGWELAERRAEILARPPGSRHPLAALVPGARALPGMAQTAQHPGLRLDSVSADPSSATVTGRTKEPTLPAAPAASRPPAFAKPKSLADRLAQLGVVNDRQPHLPPPSAHHPPASLAASPVADKFADRQRPFEPAKQPALHPVIKSRSTHSLKSASLLDDEQPEATKAQRPTTAGHLVQPAAQPDPAPRKPRLALSNRSNTTQVVPTIARHKSSKSQPHAVPSQIPDEQPPNNNLGLSAPNKVLTASLSRLAGSNIVSQRLQWSKQKEQTGANVDEFGASSKSLSQPLNDSLALLSDPNNHQTGISRRSPLFERPIQPRDASPPKPNSSARSQHDKTKSVASDIPPAPTTPSAKTINQYNKSNRGSSDEDDEMQTEYTHDLKRNKKDLHMPMTPLSPRKANAKPTTGLVRSSVFCQPPDPSLPLKHLTKNRARPPQRSPSSRIKSPAQTHRPLPSPKAKQSPALTQTEQAKTTLPSIPSFSPFVKKGTSELTAVWENQHHKKAMDIKPTSATRPLPTPPAQGPKTGVRVALPGLSDTSMSSSRPLPVPPNFSPVSASPSTLKTAPSGPSPNLVTRAEAKKKPLSKLLVASTKKLVPLDPKTIAGACQRLTDSLPIVQLELFQLHRNAEEPDFSTTFIEPEDSNTFYANERLLIFCTSSDGSHTLMVWKGKMAQQTEEVEVGRLLRKYGIEQRSRLVSLQQGYEPAELIEALGGSLMIRLGDRFELDPPQSTVFSVRSYQNGRLLVIEEFLLQSDSVREALCAGFCALVNVYDRERRLMKLFQWNGQHSDPLERQQCALVAHQVIRQSAEFKPKLVELDQGGESDEFRALFGEEDFATSYHWRFKAFLEFSPLLISSDLNPLDSLCPKSISVLNTGLEIFVIVPSSQRNQRAGIARAIDLAEHLSSTSGSNKLTVNCLVFPTLLPVDLRASVRFSYDLGRLNQGFRIPQRMNLWSLDEARIALEGGEVEILDLDSLPLGVGPEDVVGT